MSGGTRKSASKNKKEVANYMHDHISLPPLKNNSLVISAEPVSSVPPLELSYNARIRPLLNAVDKLRHLKIMKQGIQLPTIVVVGDQSSGKSSVLESLAGISLPRGQGICTRVPLIMRLVNHPSPKAESKLEFNGKEVTIDEANISDAIVLATDEIAGSGKGISNTPLTLIVKKNGVADLTMVDLPGITRVAVLGQPQNIYEQIKDIIMEYIKPEASIILNVLSATVDFSTCESIRMSQEVDRTGERTLAVVTKADKGYEGLLEKVTADDVQIGLGYVCVRNRIGDESYEEARIEEERLFENHPFQSKIDKSIVGVPVLAQKLTNIQATIIARCLPEIVRKVNERLNVNMAELKKLPNKVLSVPEAMATFMVVTGSAKESLRKILLRGEFDEYPDEASMHCTARLAEMLESYASDLQSYLKVDMTKNFLMDEIAILDETKGIALPNFLPRSAFLSILNKSVTKISAVPVVFVERVWNYMEDVVITVLMHHSENYPQLQYVTKRAASNVFTMMKQISVQRVNEYISMERIIDYTCSPEYLADFAKLMNQWEEFQCAFNHASKPSKINLEGFGEVDIEHLRQYTVNCLEQPFDLKMRLSAYWKIVLRRLVDCTALHLLFSIRELVDKELESEIVKEMMGPADGGIERMLEESPLIAGKREKLNRSVTVLMEAKDVVSNVQDKINAFTNLLIGTFTPDHLIHSSTLKTTIKL